MNHQGKPPRGAPPGQHELQVGFSESSLFPFLPVALILTDVSGTITGFNPKALEFLGNALVTGIPYEDAWKECRLFLADETPLPTNHLKPTDFIRSGDPSTERVMFVERPGADRILLREELCASYAQHGQLTGMISCFYDILPNESHQRQRHGHRNLGAHLNNKHVALKRNEDQFQKMIEEVEDYAIVLLDENGIVQNWNKGAERIKGYKEHEIVGKSFSSFYLPADRDAGLPGRLIRQAAEEGKALHEGWRLRKDGSKFWGSIVITALHEGDKIIGFLKVTRDLTERKLAEDQAREYTQQLEFQNAELQQFAFAASHDMKEPLRKINFYNNYVVTNGANELDDRSADYLNRSLAAVKRMSQLIDDLLSYSQIEASTETLKDTDLNQILEEVINTHKDMLEEDDVRFEIGNLPRMDVVPFQMRQLFDNLINNSIKYKHPERQAVIRITCDRVKGNTFLNDMQAGADTDFFKISVIDNGLGFEPHYSDKIFEIFQRLKSRSDYKGSGIGLAICKKIVQNHHGFIRATGKENEGAEFKVYLPVK
jgi:PAS domain S-box-containing protein